MDHPAQKQLQADTDDTTITKKQRRAVNDDQPATVKKRRTEQDDQQQSDNKRAVDKNAKSVAHNKKPNLKPSVPAKFPSRQTASKALGFSKQLEKQNYIATPARQVTREEPSGAREQPLIQGAHQSVLDHPARGYPNLRPSVAADILQVWRNALNTIEDSQNLTGITNTKAAEQAAPSQAKSKRARELPRATQALAQESPSQQQQQVVPQTPEMPQPYHTSYGGNSDRARGQRIILWMNQTRKAEDETEIGADKRKKHMPLDGANDEDSAEAPKGKPKKRSAIPTLGRRNQVIVASRDRDTDELIEGEGHVVMPGETTYYFDLDHFADGESSPSDDAPSIEPTEDYHYITVWRWGKKQRKLVPNNPPTEAEAATKVPVESAAAAPKKSGPHMAAAARAAQGSKDVRPTKRANGISGGPDSAYGGATGAAGEQASDENNKKRGKQARAGGRKNRDEDVEKQDDEEDEGNTAAPLKKRRNDLDSRLAPVGGSPRPEQKVYQTRQKVKDDKIKQQGPVGSRW